MGNRSKTRSPSGATRWLKCGGSVRLIEQMKWESKGSIFTEEGSCAHKVAETLLKLPKSEHQHYLAAIVNSTGWTTFGKPEWESITIDKEMLEFVQIYVNIVFETKQDEGTMFIEDSLPLFYEPQADGTADAVIINSTPTGGHLHILDLKFGKGVKVYIGPQLEIYAINAIEKYEWAVEFELVTMHIIQPRLNHIVSKTINMQELAEIRDKIQKGADAAISPDAPFNPGVEQCRFCPGQTEGTCLALAEHNLASVGLDFDSLYEDKVSAEMPSLELLHDEEIRIILDNAPLIESWLSNLKKAVYDKLADNQNFPGYKLVEGKSNRRWIDEDEAYMLLSKHFDNEQILEEKLISPAKTDKLLKHESIDLIHEVQQQITKPKGKPTLVNESDPRESVHVNRSEEYANDFDNLN